MAELSQIVKQHAVVLTAIQDQLTALETRVSALEELNR